MTYVTGGEFVPLVFLCYRGIDRSYAPMLIDRELTRRFGREHVFEAGRSNTPGTDIPDAILDSVARCSLLIPLIDPAWVEDREQLFREKDWVRREIAHALRHRRRILPVLLDGAEVPRAGDLPDDIADLPRKIVLRMRSRTADADLARLVGEVERLAPELVLAGLTDPAPPAPARPADLLRAEHAVFPFRHRPELDELDEWCRDQEAHPVRLVTGPSGAGKTRVGLRLAQQRHGDGWAAGRLSPTAGPHSLDRLHESVHDTLIVVDDAETRPAVVRAALQSLVGAPAATVRVLLLARAAGAWLDDLRADADDAVAATAEKIAVLTLEPLRATAADLDLALTTLAERGADFGFGAPAPSDRQPPATLMEVQAEALVRLLSEDGPVSSPMRRLAELEKEHWQRAAQAQGLGDLRPRDLGEIMAAVSLFGADTDQEAEDLLRSLIAFQGRPRDVAAGLDLVRTLLPGPAALNALQPDLLAVEVVADCLRAGRAPAVAVAAASGSQIARAVVLLGRCLADDPGLAERGRAFATADPVRFLTVAMTALTAVPDPGPLVEVMTTALDDLPEGGLSSVVDALPQRSRALAHFAVAATEAALATATDEQERARLSAQLAVRLVHLGERAEEAVTLARDAVSVLRADDERAEAYDSLALALGAGPEAQDAGDRAVTLFRALAPSGVRFAGALAHALHNQSVRLGVAGAGPADLARALDYAREAERRTAALEGNRPTAFRSLYADVLDNLAQILAKTGGRSAAESAARRALALRRSLAAARPDAYRPQLAATLNTLAVIRAGDDATDDQLQPILDAAGITGDELHHAQLEAVTRAVSGLPADEFIPAYAAAPAVRWSKGGIRPPDYLELHDEDWTVGLHEQGNREHLRAVVVAGVLIEALDRPERIVWLVPLLSAVVDPVTVETTAAGLRFVLTRVPEPEIPAALADTVNLLDFADLVAAIARAPESITLGTGTTVVIRPAPSSA